MENVIITVDTEKLINFFKKDNGYGLRDKPLKADCFCLIESPKTTSFPYILNLKKNTKYKFTIKCDSKSDSSYIIDPNSATLIFSMIQTDIPTLSDWEKIFKLNPDYSIITDGRLLYPRKNLIICSFEFETVEKISLHHNLQYHFAFKIVNVNTKKVLLTVVDPLIANTSDD